MFPNEATGIPLAKLPTLLKSVCGGHAMLRSLLKNVAVDTLRLHTVMHLLAMHFGAGRACDRHFVLLLHGVHRSAWVVHLAQLVRLAHIWLRRMATHAWVMSVPVPRTQTLISETHVQELLRVGLAGVTVAAAIGINTVGVREFHLLSLELGLDAFAVGRVANEWQDWANSFDQQCSLIRLRIVKGSL